MKNIIELFGCTWKVLERYTVSDEDMKEHELFFKNRIKIQCIKTNEFSFIKVGDIIDHANTTNI